MKIRKPKGVSTSQIAVAITLGIFSGFYIFQPLFTGENKVIVRDKGRNW